MISLAFHHDRIVAATVSDGGDFVTTSELPRQTVTIADGFSPPVMP